MTQNKSLALLGILILLLGGCSVLEEGGTPCDTAQAEGDFFLVLALILVLAGFLFPPLWILAGFFGFAALAFFFTAANMSC